MKKQKEMVILRLLSLSLIMLLSMQAWSQQRQVRGTAIEKIVAKVDSYIVLKSDLEARYLAGLRDGKFNQATGRCLALEELVNEKLLVAKAEIDSVEIADDQVMAELEGRISAIMQQIGGNTDILEKQFGKTLGQIRAELYDDIKEQAMQEAMQEEITMDIKVSPSEVKAFFDAIPPNQRPFYSAEIILGVIEKKPEAGKETRDKVRAQLNTIRQQIINKEVTFGEMARQYSMDGSARNGGNLGYFSRGQLDPTYEATAMKMRVGEISPVIETEFGFHIVELLDRRGGEFNTNHIIIIPEPTEDDKRKAISFLDSVRNLIVEEKITWENAAKQFSDDKTSNTNGGLLRGRYGQYVSVDDPSISPDVFLTIDTMKVGSISRPLSFRTEQGNEHFRILYYKDRIPPHQASLEKDYEKIYNAALAKKRDEEIAAWLIKSRQEVFIEISEEYRNCSWVEQKPEGQ
jgi:peptidyl-prolyl cis-trans isomerase SurA